MERRRKTSTSSEQRARFREQKKEESRAVLRRLFTLITKTKFSLLFNNDILWGDTNAKIYLINPQSSALTKFVRVKLLRSVSPYFESFKKQIGDEKFGSSDSENRTFDKISFEF